jgi:hypothetical protein
MPLQTSVSLKGAQREIIDYMRDVYQIDDIKVSGGGRHLHIEYVYAGRRYQNTLPQSSGGDPNWISTRKHDLRRELGEPPPPLTTKKRTLDEMTQELQARAANLQSGTAMATAIIQPSHKPIITAAAPVIVPGIGKTDTAPPPIPQRRFPCTIGTKKGDYDHDITFYLTRELSDAMEAAFGKNRRYVVAYHYPQHWIVRPSRDAGRAIEPAHYRLRATGTEAIERLGRFMATGAEAVLKHNRVEFKLLAMPVRLAPPEPEPEPIKVMPPPAPAPVEEPIKLAPLPVQDTTTAPPTPPPAPSLDPRERLRDLLRQIKAIEAEGIYQLVNRNGWRWRAADIGLDEDN